MTVMAHLKSLTFMVTSIVAGGVTAFFVLHADRWVGGVLALAVYGALLAADHLWTRRSPAST
ncbi:hypothetical protein IFT73_08930 [Aeromicrobium sp. CFBP 8757]|uniref:hypothetical protein n=1 Tax=Aeromicrobium sp. CFBP 8757 TaxID=2775288 RepID=UPI00177EC9B6|nr:hypothetical protein [Aeromicrobium sp. CFBP 8757]MBD8606976.1 hypothetical protein [Aeromicrobium sp. CFBP 8757]